MRTRSHPGRGLSWLLAVTAMAAPTHAQGLATPDATFSDATSSFVGNAHQHFGFAVDSGADWDDDGLDDIAVGGLTVDSHINTAEVRVISALTRSHRWSSRSPGSSRSSGACRSRSSMISMAAASPIS